MLGIEHMRGRSVGTVYTASCLRGNNFGDAGRPIALGHDISNRGGELSGIAVLLEGRAPANFERT